jgi:hypothetical protein
VPARSLCEDQFLLAVPSSRLRRCIRNSTAGVTPSSVYSRGCVGRESADRLSANNVGRGATARMGFAKLSARPSEAVLARANGRVARARRAAAEHADLGDARRTGSNGVQPRGRAAGCRPRRTAARECGRVVRVLVVALVSLAPVRATQVRQRREHAARGPRGRACTGERGEETRVEPRRRAARRPGRGTRRAGVLRASRATHARAARARRWLGRPTPKLLRRLAGV